MEPAANGGGRVIVPQEQIDQAVHMAEVQAGLRCAACGERLEHGVQCILVQQTWDRSGEPVIRVITPTVCGRCDDSGGLMREATAMREVKQRFLEDGLPVPLPARAQEPADG
jgi:hypothetical protein